VCENETERGICVGSVAVHSPPEPAEPVQSSDRLLAGRLTREFSNSWMMARKRGTEREREREPRQSRPVPRLHPPETPEERKRGGAGGEAPAALMFCLLIVLQS